MANDTDKRRDDDDEEQPRRPLRPWEQAETLPTTQTARTAPQPWERGEALGTAAPGEGDTLASRLRAREDVLKKQLNPPRAETRLGRVGQVLGTIGQDIGTALEPGIMQRIPGTRAQRAAELYQTREALGQEQAREATAKEAAERTGIERERTGIQRFTAESEAAARGLPHLVTGEGHTTFPDPSDPDQRPRFDWEVQGQLIPAVPKGENPLTYKAGAPPAAPLPSGTAGTLPTTTPTAPPPVAAPGAGATYKPPDDETRYVAKYLKDNKLENTADNVAKARAMYKEGGSIGDAEAATMAAQIHELLDPYKIDARPFLPTGKMTRPEAQERLRAARDAQMTEKAIQAPIQQQRRKDERTMGYGEDQTGQVHYTSQATAEDNKWQFRPLPPGQVQQDAHLLRQLDDVQRNVSRYRTALNAIPAAISENHALLMQQLMNDDRIKAGLIAGQIPGIEFLAQIAKETNKASIWNTLSEPERNAMIGYLRMRGAVITYMKALANSGRASDRQFVVEEATIPSPIVGATVANPQMDAVQENIDMASMGLPDDLTGIPHPKKIREQVEGARPAAGAAPGPGAPPPGAKILRYNPQTRKLE